MKRSSRFSGVYIHKAKDGDKTYYIMLRDRAGKLIREKVGKRSEGYTEQEASKIRFERVHQERHPDLYKKEREHSGKAATFDEAFESWADFKTGSGIKRVQDSRWVYNRHIKDLIGKVPLDSITPQFIVTRINTLFKSYKGNGSLYHIHYVLRGVFKHAIQNDSLNFRGPNPMLNVKTPRIKGKRERFLSKSEAKQLLDALRKEDEEVYLQVAIMLMTGMRKHEVMNLKLNDIDIPTKLIRVLGKGEKKRFAETPEGLTDILFQVYSLDPERESLWSTRHFKDRIFRKVVADLGLNFGVEKDDVENKVCVHTLRHTFASWLVQKGTPIIVVKELMGHTDIGMTMRYAKLGERPGKAAVEGLGKYLFD